MFRQCQKPIAASAPCPEEIGATLVDPCFEAIESDVIVHISSRKHLGRVFVYSDTSSSIGVPTQLFRPCCV